MTVLKDIPLSEVLVYLDRRALFNARWKLKNGVLEKTFNFDPEEKLRDIVQKVEEKKVPELGLSFSIFRFVKKNNRVEVEKDGGGKILSVFCFPEKSSPEDRDAGHFFRKKENAERGALFAVTAGGGFKKELRTLMERKKYGEYFLLNGFACELTEAAAKFVNKKIQISADVLNSRRYGFGFPGCPDISQQHKILKLLNANTLGINLTDGFQLVPEFSTCGFIVFD